MGLFGRAATAMVCPGVASVSRPIPRGRKTHGSKNREPWGTPAGGVVGLGSLVELELAIRVFAKNKFRKERLGHPAPPARNSYGHLKEPLVN